MFTGPVRSPPTGAASGGLRHDAAHLLPPVRGWRRVPRDRSDLRVRGPLVAAPLPVPRKEGGPVDLRDGAVRRPLAEGEMTVLLLSLPAWILATYFWRLNEDLLKVSRMQN